VVERGHGRRGEKHRWCVMISHRTTGGQKYMWEDGGINTLPEESFPISASCSRGVVPPPQPWGTCDGGRGVRSPGSAPGCGIVSASPGAAPPRAWRAGEISRSSERPGLAEPLVLGRARPVQANRFLRLGQGFLLSRTIAPCRCSASAHKCTRARKVQDCPLIRQM
jgi:hypothetical protein